MLDQSARVHNLQRCMSLHARQGHAQGRHAAVPRRRPGHQRGVRVARRSATTSSCVEIVGVDIAGKSTEEKMALLRDAPRGAVQQGGRRRLRAPRLDPRRRARPASGCTSWASTCPQVVAHGQGRLVGKRMDIFGRNVPGSTAILQQRTVGRRRVRRPRLQRGGGPDARRHRPPDPDRPRRRRGVEPEPSALLPGRHRQAQGRGAGRAPARGSSRRSTSTCAPGSWSRRTSPASAPPTC